MLIFWTHVWTSLHGGLQPSCPIKGVEHEQLFHASVLSPFKIKQIVHSDVSVSKVSRDWKYSKSSIINDITPQITQDRKKNM